MILNADEIDLFGTWSFACATPETKNDETFVPPAPPSLQRDKVPTYVVTDWAGRTMEELHYFSSN